MVPPNDLNSPDFLAHLQNLNTIVARHAKAYGVEHPGHFKMEGSLLYLHAKEYSVEDLPDAALARKARNFLLVTTGVDTLLEVGLNAGHSALLALFFNTSLCVSAIDICHHHYARDCAQYLLSAFPGRFRFFPGDSRDILPMLATHYFSETYRMFHVDGGHGEEVCRSDISNCIRLAHERSTLLLDDTSASHIRDVYAEFCVRGFLVTESIGGQFVPEDQVYCHVRRA